MKNRFFFSLFLFTLGVDTATRTAIQSQNVKYEAVDSMDERTMTINPVGPGRPTGVRHTDSNDDQRKKRTRDLKKCRLWVVKWAPIASSTHMTANSSC